MRHYNIPIFLPELGCPFRCVYCNQNSIAAQYHLPDTEEVKHIIVRHLKSFPIVERVVEAAFFGGNFTGLPETVLVEYLEALQPFLNSGEVQSLRCSTRPDFITPHILQILKRYGMKHIELGAQSTNDAVLKACGREHDFECLQRASRLILEEGFVLGLQMMTGLPESTPEIDLQTARDIVALGASETRIYPCIVVRGTALEHLYHKGKYHPQNLDDAVHQAADLLSYFIDNQIHVLRMGLHPSDELDHGDCIAGPYHHNFAEMVYSAFWKRKFSAITESGEGLTVTVHPSQRTKAIGYRSENRNELLKRFDRVVFVGCDALPTYGFSVAVCQRGQRPFFIASSLMPQGSKSRLASFGEVLWLSPTDFVYPSIAAHPDIYFFPFAPNGLVFAPNTPEGWVAALHKKGFKLVKGSKPLGKRHPETVYYNACASEHLLIHNFQYTDQRILNLCCTKRQIQVSQAYTRCNLLAISDNAFITSDVGICNILKQEGYDVLFIDPRQIKLEGHEYGFFPGCCGLSGNRLLVCGTTWHLAEKADLDAFLNRHGVELMELSDGPLTDVGSIVCLSS